MTLDINIGPATIKDVQFENIFRHPPERDARRQQSILSKWLSRESGTIKFKIFSYTSQTTISMLSQALSSMKSRDIEIQVLRPSLQEPLKIWNVLNDDDKKYWEEKIKDADAADRFWLEIPECEQRCVKINLHPFDPLLKAIFINDKYALLGFYPLKKHTKKSVLPNVTSWDYIGYEVKMMELHNSDTGNSGHLFNCALDYFQKIWENFSKPHKNFIC
jgi:hypothetical protein